MKKIRIVIPAIAALTCASLAAMAVAHVVRHDSTVTIGYHDHGVGDDTMDGQVHSARQACESFRFVRIKEVTPGRDKTAGAGFTNFNGHYSIEHKEFGEYERGEYYARAVKEVRRRNASHAHICRADNSGTVIVSDGPVRLSDPVTTD